MKVKLLIDPRYRVILSSGLVRYSRPSIRSWLRWSDRNILLYYRRNPSAGRYGYGFDYKGKDPVWQHRFESSSGDMTLR